MKKVLGWLLASVVMGAFMSMFMFPRDWIEMLMHTGIGTLFWLGMLAPMLSE